MIEFGKRLAAFRKEKGFSQQELADMMETSKTTVTNWETGRFKPTWDKLDMLASIFGIHVSALIEGSDAVIMLVDDEEKEIDLSTVSTEELLREIHRRMI